MIFVGDIALPFSDAIRLKNLPSELQESKWFGNLEGSLIEHTDGLINSKGVFNELDAIRELTTLFNFAGFALANNHLEDFDEVEITIENLKKLNIPFIGAGQNRIDASKPLLVSDGTLEFCILNFGWSAIQCKVADANTPGVNAYDRKYVISEVTKALQKHPDTYLVCYFHWNYELELYPQPADRELSKKLIDMGADAIIGCHSHRVQPIEFYKDKPIVYGMGNWLFPQNVYFKEKLKFPMFTFNQIAFEICENKSFKIHYFDYDTINQDVGYVVSEVIDSLNYKKSVFSLLSDREYIEWFKQNRYQKKLLPVFLFRDNVLINSLKILWVRTIRHLMIKLVKKIRN